MSDSAADTVLKRKASAGRGLSGGAVTPERALSQAMAKAAQDLMRLALGTAMAREGRLSLAEVIEALPDRALIALLEGPGEALGLMALSPEMLASLIEMQTTGRIAPGAVTPRRPTRTDAAMSAPFIDRVMGELDVLLANHPAIIWAGGFRYASYLEDARPLGLLLEDCAYRSFRFALDLGEDGGRQGGLVLALPAEGRGPPPQRLGAGERGDASPAAIGAAADWQARLEEAVLGAEARLEAVLDRLTLPLAEVLALKPGAMVPLKPGALTRLRVEGNGRRVVATGRLGQCQGSLAVRLHPAVDDTARPPQTGATEEAAVPPALPGEAADQAAAR